jgi:hypothetical protein
MSITKMRAAIWSVILTTLSLLISQAVFSQQRAVAAPIAETSAGKLHGETQSGVFVFRGIRYAQAPVKNLRFRPAQTRHAVERHPRRSGLCAGLPTTRGH